MRGRQNMPVVTHRPVIFRHVCNMAEKSSYQSDQFFSPILPIAFTFVHVFHQNVIYLLENATEIVKFLEAFAFKIRFFLIYRFFVFEQKLKFIQIH